MNCSGRWMRIISAGLRAIGAGALAAIMAAAPSQASAEDFYLHNFKKKHLDSKFYAEGATFGDLNKDGKMDVIAGPYWWEGPDFEKRHEYYTPKTFDPLGYSDNFFAFVQDFNGDGWNDILIYGFPGKDASWYENPKGAEGNWKRHLVFDIVDNESPTWADIDGDGKNEIIFHSGDRFGFASPDWANPTAKWKFRPISKKMAGGKFTHGLGIGDIDGDGKPDIMWKSGWFKNPGKLDGDPEWEHFPYKFATQGGAQMYAYDFDGDGDNDVVTSIEAHGYGLTWYEQVKVDGKITFKPHVIIGRDPKESKYGLMITEMHAIDLIDMDGDGVKDVITGKRYWAHGPKGSPDGVKPPVIYWFRTVRSGKAGEVDFVPNLIDDDSGVGVQVVAGDFTQDGLPDVVIGNKKGTYVLIHEKKKVTEEEYKAAQPKPKNAAGLAPKEAASAMTVPPGFTVHLSAGEPDVKQPIAMAIDDRGRLWVAEAYTYPTRLPGDKGKDRILIFEDTNGDHVFDKKTVFIEGLNLVSGMEVGFGGVWVGAAPYLLFIPDKNGDDQPDGPPKVVLDGWAWQDTHETLNTFIWGPDGWLYGCHGVFTHSRVGKPGTPDDQRAPINAGIWRFHPVKEKFEVFAWGTSNPWGVDFDDRGQAFATACVIPHLYHIIQGGRYVRQAGRHFDPYVFDDIKTIAKHRHWVGNQWNNEDREKSDTNGGGHAHAGAMVYLGGSWPAQYRDQIFMNNIHGARINQDKLARKGSGYVGDGAPDFIKANDRWSQIINLRYGPDGQAWMIDWYDANECHHGSYNGHDRTNGRIFKVVYGKPEPVKVDLTKLSDKELIAHQLNANDWYVRHSRRILQERAAAGTLDRATHAGLADILLQNQDETRRLRALWALHVTGGISEEIALQLLKTGSEYVKAWTLQLNLEARPASEAFIAAMTKLAADDPSPVVRLYLTSALQRMPVEQRWEIAAGLVSHSEDASDHNLPLMNWYCVEPLVAADPTRAMQLAKASRIPQVTRYIIRRAASDPAQLASVMSLLSTAQDVPTQTLILSELSTALRTQAKLAAPAGWDAAYEKLSVSSDATVRQHLQFIAVRFGDPRIFPAMRKTLADKAADGDERSRALDILTSARDEQNIPILQQVTAEPALRARAIRALAAYDHPDTPGLLLKAFEGYGPADRAEAINTLSSRPAYAKALLTAIKTGKLPRTELSAFAARQMNTFGDKEIDATLAEVWGTVRQTSDQKIQEMKKYKAALTPAVLAKADLSAGRLVYNQLCATCHTLHNVGGKIGPDLTGSNRANLDYILENILDPSAVVGKDYQLTVIQTTDGRALAGTVAEETSSAVTIRTLTENVTLATAEIKSRQVLPTSIMPEGQLGTLQPAQVRDLIGYLASPVQVSIVGSPSKIDPATHRVLGALEGEKLKVIKVSAGKAGPQDMRPFGVDKWSDNSQLWWTGGKKGDTLEVALNVKNAGKYELALALAKARDYGVFQVLLDGKKINEPIDCYDPKVIPTGLIQYGTHELAAGEHRLTFQIVGANPASVKAYMLGLDYLMLTETK